MEGEDRETVSRREACRLYTASEEGVILNDSESRHSPKRVVSDEPVRGAKSKGRVLRTVTKPFLQHPGRS